MSSPLRLLLLAGFLGVVVHAATPVCEASDAGACGAPLKRDTEGSAILNDKDILMQNRVVVETSTETSVILPMPAREQWRNRHGYCGSTSIQTSGLYFGNWISEDQARKSVGNHELLPGSNLANAAGKLHFKVEEWNGASAANQAKYGEKEQYEDFMVWVKGQVLKRHPVIIGYYISPLTDADYDHIMPSIGILSKHNDGKYHGDDWMIINNNYQHEPIAHTFDEWKGDRSSCSRTEDTGGCIPSKTDYGVAIAGISDKKSETTPVSLSVSRWNEPNLVNDPALGEPKPEKPVGLVGTLSTSYHEQGVSYILLRYNGIASVPESGFGSAAGQAAAETVYKFVAPSKTFWTYTDPKPIPSDGAVFYRLVKDPESSGVFRLTENLKKPVMSEVP